MFSPIVLPPVNGIPVVGLQDAKIMDYVIDAELAGKSPSASAANQ
jgi:hypothetical protein